MQPTANYTTLSALQCEIKAAIDASMPLPRWITAEIGEIKVNYSGHCYLELVEKGAGEGSAPVAKASAVVWRNQYAMISSYFTSATGRDLCAGMNVLVKVTVTYHQLYGLSLQITDIDPNYTLGDLARQRRETVEKLKADGVFDMNRELERPLVMQRVAVVSSRNAAGYQDFMNELLGADYYFRTELFDAFMQGDNTESSVINAMERIADRMEEFDCVALIRGGGSQSDLSYFDSYDLCYYMAQFPLPVFTGIGHDKDESVADMVASQAFKTPTAVAGFLLGEMAGFDYMMETLASNLTGLASDKIGECARLTEGQAGILGQLSMKSIYGFRSGLEELSHGLSGVSRRRLGGEESRQAAFGEFMGRLAAQVAPRREARLSEFERGIADTVAGRLVARNKELSLLERSVSANAPESIMRRGFAVVRSDGRLVRSAGGLAVGGGVSVEFADGEATAEIKNVKTTKR